MSQRHGASSTDSTPFPLGGGGGGGGGTPAGGKGEPGGAAALLLRRTAGTAGGDTTALLLRRTADAARAGARAGEAARDARWRAGGIAGSDKKCAALVDENGGWAPKIGARNNGTRRRSGGGVGAAERSSARSINDSRCFRGDVGSEVVRPQNQYERETSGERGGTAKN